MYILQLMIVAVITLGVANLTYNAITYSKRYNRVLYRSRYGITLIIVAITLEILCHLFGIL